jgi:hypothetical protein
MAKSTRSDMDAELKIRLPGKDKKAFEEAADKMRVSLSAWMRIAGWQKIENDAEEKSARKGGR